MRANQQTSTRCAGWCRLVLPFLKDTTLPLGQPMRCTKGKVVNSVGAGDSMVAGFVAGWMQTRSYSFALRLGTACGSATAFSLGLATKEKIDELLKEI